MPNVANILVVNYCVSRLASNLLDAHPQCLAIGLHAVSQDVRRHIRPSLSAILNRTKRPSVLMNGKSQLAFRSAIFGGKRCIFRRNASHCYKSSTRSSIIGVRPTAARSLIIAVCGSRLCNQPAPSQSNYRIQDDHATTYIRTCSTPPKPSAFRPKPVGPRRSDWSFPGDRGTGLRMVSTVEVLHSAHRAGCVNRLRIVCEVRTTP